MSQIQTSEFPQNNIHHEKTCLYSKQKLQVYGLPKETVNAIMMLHKNTEAMVRSPDGDIDSLNIFTQYISATHVYILIRVRTHNLVRSNKWKWFHLKKHEKVNSLQKLWLIQTTQMILYILQIQQSKQKPVCIGKNSTLKQSVCVVNRKELCTLYDASL